MKSLVQYINESNSDLEKNLDILAHTIAKHNDNKKICQTVKKLVDNNTTNIIDLKDINSLKKGMLIGYLPNKSFYANANVKVAVADWRSYQGTWLTYHAFADKNEESKFNGQGGSITSISKEKIYPGFFEDGWKVIYIEKEHEDLVDELRWYK